MAEKLTLQQAQAVSDRGGRLLVSAAAGSGKTKVLVDRLLSYLRDPQNPANLDEFLIITYTKAAASELRGKIASKLTEAIAAEPENRHLQHQMQRLFLTKISTVHGFCSDLLREYAYRLDLSADFRVADENECREIRETVLDDLLDRAYEKAGEDGNFRAFVDTQGLGRDDRLVAEIILSVYNSARCHLDPEGWLQDCLEESEVEELTDVGETVWGKYLMDDFFSYLDCQIKVIGTCARLAEASDNMGKPAQNLRDTLYQMERLRESTTWDDIVRQKDIDYGRLSFPRKGVDETLAERIKACRTACKKGLEKNLRRFADSSEQIFTDLAQVAAGTRGLVALVREFGTDYDRAKASRRVLDFGDLEHKTLDLLLGRKRSGITVAAREIGSRYREIMVDEYQDSNGVQDAIFTALTEEKQNCFMVGDVKQSIYQFRLADPGIFLQKYRDYIPADDAEPGMGRKVLLSANFRSGGEVVEAVNDVFRTCMSPAVGGLTYGDAEMLREGIPHEVLPEPAVTLYGIQVREDTYAEESAFVAEEVSRLLDGTHMIRGKESLRPIVPDDIVILLRSPGSVGGKFQQALEQRGIRCSSGGGTDLLGTEEIGTLRNILETVANPRQDIPLVGALASPVFGFTADDLASFRGKQTKGSIYEALLAEKSPKTEYFRKTLALFRETARMNTLAELIEVIFRETRMDSIYGSMPGGEAKKANLQTFYQLAADYEQVSRRDLNQFLEYLKTQEEKGLIVAEETPGGCVTLMSIHKSKGLEFPVVILSGLSREFNRDSLRAQVICDKDLGIGLSVADPQNRVRYPAISKRAIIHKAGADGLSEEMRVLYVAMTRARDRLIMTYASEHLEKDLQDIARRLDLSGTELLTRDVSCPGQWVLLEAMQRTEAGEFFGLGGRPDETRTSRFPWKIQVTAAPECNSEGTGVAADREQLPTEIEEHLREALSFHYAHEAATRTPSKQTATQRKGRVKDQEAAEEAKEPEKIARSWRKPSFLEHGPHGKAYGTVMHTVMQYIRYGCCADEAGVREEVSRLVREKFLTEEQGKAVNIGQIAEFFQTEPGKKLRQGVKCVREFKFSILDDGPHYGEGLEGEAVLLQGVVDCALLEPEGITVIDFKTDFVTEEILDQVTARYTSQIRTYADALSRIFGQKVKTSCLYFFRLNRFVPV